MGEKAAHSQFHIRFRGGLKNLKHRMDGPLLNSVVAKFDKGDKEGLEGMNEDLAIVRPSLPFRCGGLCRDARIN